MKGSSAVIHDMKESFLESFSKAPEEAGQARRKFLRVRVGSGLHAIAIDELAAIRKSKSLTEVPSAFPEFLGLANLRGEIVPVYDMARLLGSSEVAGEDARAAGDDGHWLLVVQSRHGPVALEVRGFDGYLESAEDAIAPIQPEAGQAQSGAAPRLSHAIGGRQAVLVINLRPLVDNLMNRIQPSPVSKEANS